MPLPTPSDGETQREFIARCMGSSTMKSEYGDQKQRVAICIKQWEEVHGAIEPLELEEKPDG